MISRKSFTFSEKRAKTTLFYIYIGNYMLFFLKVWQFDIFFKYFCIFMYNLTYLINEGFKMVYSKNKELLSYAIKMGCKTVAEFAMFLRARESILAL